MTLAIGVRKHCRLNPFCIAAQERAVGKTAAAVRTFRLRRIYFSREANGKSALASASEAKSCPRIPHRHFADGFLALSISSRRSTQLSHTCVIQVRQAPKCTASAGTAMRCQASVPHPSEHSLRLGCEASLMICCVAPHAVPPQRYATPFQHSSARTPRFVVSWCGVSPRRTTSLRARGAVPSRSASSPRL